MENEKENVKITIEDDRIGFEVSEVFAKNKEESSEEKNAEHILERGVGIGMRYVRLSLEAFYKGKAEMNIESEIGKGTRVTILLPHVEN